MKIFPTASFALMGVAALVLTCAPATAALTASQVEAIARQVTVKINASTPGSGVIIKRDGNTYTLLTAAHVVATEDDYEVITDQGQRYAIVSGSIQKIPNLDLATVKFVSERPLAIAELGDSNEVKSGEPCYVSGHPLKLQTFETNYRFSPGYVAANSGVSDNDGYSLAYFNDTFQGMSGGPVLNNQGQVIGIHGRSLSPFKSSAGISKDLNIKFGVNMAIPINSFDRNSQGFKIRAAADDQFLLGVRAITKEDISGPRFRAQLSNPELDSYRTSIQYFDKAIGLNSNYAAAYIVRGIAYSLIQNNEKALEDLNTGLQINPDHPLAYYFRSTVYQNLGIKEKAAKDIDQWISLDPDNPSLYEYRAQLRAAAGDTDSAQRDLDTIFKSDPGNARAHFTKATILMRSDLKEALIEINKAIEIDPEMSQAYLMRGMIFRLLNNTEKSYQDLKIAKELDPNILGQYDPTIFAVAGDQYLENLEQVQQIDPHNAKLHFYKAASLIEKSSDYRSAVTELDNAIRINPNFAQAYLLRGAAFLQLGNRSKALLDFKKVKDIDPELYQSQNIDHKLRLFQ